MRKATAGWGVAMPVAISLLSPGAAHAQAPQRGGVLRAMLRDDLSQGFAIHEYREGFRYVVIGARGIRVAALQGTSCPAQPHVRNLVPHHNIDNDGRMQDVWLGR